MKIPVVSYIFKYCFSATYRKEINSKAGNIATGIKKAFNYVFRKKESGTTTEEGDQADSPES